MKAKRQSPGVRLLMVHGDRDEGNRAGTNRGVRNVPLCCCRTTVTASVTQNSILCYLSITVFFLLSWATLEHAVQSRLSKNSPMLGLQGCTTRLSIAGSLGQSSLTPGNQSICWKRHHPGDLAWERAASKLLQVVGRTQCLKVIFVCLRLRDASHPWSLAELRLFNP